MLRDTVRRFGEERLDRNRDCWLGTLESELVMANIGMAWLGKHGAEGVNTFTVFSCLGSWTWRRVSYLGKL